MKQENRGENAGNNDKGKNPQTEGKAIWSTNGTAIAIQIFLISLFLLWVFIPDHVPDPSEAAKVFIESAFSLAIVIVVVVHAIMYYKQAKAMDAQIQAAERNTIYAQRAYVYAQIGGVVEDIFDITLLIENSGNSPAVNVRLSYSAGFRKALPQKATGDWNKFHSGYRIGVLPPKIHYQHMLYHRPVPKPQELQTYYGRGSTYHVWGEITYQDVFGNEWYTSFNFRIIATSIAKINIFPEVVGNEAT